MTRFRFRLPTTLLILFLVAQMVPVEALTIPRFFLMRDFGALNWLPSLVLAASGGDWRIRRQLTDR